MDLRDYWRPKNDNSLGIHIAPTGSHGEGLEFWLDRVVEMRLKWVTTLNKELDDFQRIARRNLGCVCRPYLTLDDDWGDLGIIAERMLAAGLGPYMQVYNEWSDSRESKAYNRLAFIYKWIFAAENIIHHGGYPGLQVLDPEEVRDTLRVIKAEGKEYIFDKMWFSCHNYTSNHPPAFPYDGLNSYTVYDKEGYSSMLVFLAFDRVFREEIGHSVPIFCTEGLWCIGDSMDDRYPTLEVKYAEGTPEWPNARGFLLHAQYTKETFEQFRTGKLVTGEDLPDFLFAMMPWLLVSQGIEGQFVGGDTDYEENAWYSDQLSKTKHKTIEAVKAIPPFVRRFSWDEEPAPEKPEEETVAYTYELDFARYATEHPKRVGQPISPLVQIGAGEAVQRTEKGVLWWDGQTTLYVPYVDADGEVAMLRQELEELMMELRQSDAELKQALARLTKIRTAFDE